MKSDILFGVEHTGGNIDSTKAEYQVWRIERLAYLYMNESIAISCLESTPRALRHPGLPRIEFFMLGSTVFC